MAPELGFPLWLRLTHFFNFLFMTLLIRSGFQILADHPRLYWNDYSKPGTEWIHFADKKVPENELYTSMDDAVSFPSWLALPGGFHSLGAGRHWHFFSVFFWVLNGLIYIVCLFSTENWQRLIPTSWEIIPKAWDVFVGYLHFQSPPLSEFNPYNPLQQLAYAAVVFIMPPLIILTGIVQAPAIAARFPWSVRLFGGHQPARSIHFLLTIGFILFTLVHVALVVIEHFGLSMQHIVLGTVPNQSTTQEPLAITIGLSAIAFVIMLNIFLNWWNTKFPRLVQHLTQLIVNPIIMKPLYSLKSVQNYPKSRLGHHFWVNGYPPDSGEWVALSKNDFKDYQLEVTGLVENPLMLTLNELKAMPKEVQLTEHICIQGWTGFAEWGGVPLSEIINRCRPKSSVAWVVFHSYQHPKEDNLEYYTTITIEEAEYPQTILAYEMNGETLPLNHGAPIRLRMESLLGYKMCKWIKCIEFIEKLSDVGLGQGGYREDQQYYSVWARI